MKFGYMVESRSMIFSKLLDGFGLLSAVAAPLTAA